MLHQRWVASSILATYRPFLSKNFHKERQKAGGRGQRVYFDAPSKSSIWWLPLVRGLKSLPIGSLPPSLDKVDHSTALTAPLHCVKEVR